ncbi:MAG: hypothetical protein KFB97_08595 [Cyanobium sp. M30B3]|nr:MAG: hypothetical protein KFB97_08595 [Cyanobium sp. M30B3]
MEDVGRQLRAFDADLQGSNPLLYRDLALYLQVLREGLLNGVQQACFHLATRFYPERYCALSPEQRAGLHGRIGELVQRCCSVLTVEQLVQLAGQIGRERLQQQQRRQREWLAQLRKAGDEISDRPPEPEEGSDERGVVPEPAGSIRLNAGLPVDLERWQGLIPSAAEPPVQAEADLLEEEGGAEAADPLEGLLGPEAEALLNSLLEGSAPGRLVPPWDSSALPTDPLALQVWLEGFERALVRRLRNLSHALNVELLRSGLSRSLLPPSLLQAALQGQLEPQPAPANLLRLQVPLAPDSGGDFDSVALLLRLSDLELDQPRLRSCRSRWQRHRQQIRRMAERTRRLRRQLQRLEAERLWHQDNPRPQPPNPSQASTKPG